MEVVPLGLSARLGPDVADVTEAAPASMEYKFIRPRQFGGMPPLMMGTVLALQAKVG